MVERCDVSFLSTCPLILLLNITLSLHNTDFFVYFYLFLNNFVLTLLSRLMIFYVINKSNYSL